MPPKVVQIDVRFQARTVLVRMVVMDFGGHIAVRHGDREISAMRASGDCLQPVSFAIAVQAQTKYCIRQGASCDQPAEKVTIDAAEGKRVSEKAAVFKCNEVALNAPGYARGFGTVIHTEYLVHSVNEPKLRKAFKSFGKMQAWFKEHGQLKPK